MNTETINSRVEEIDLNTRLKKSRPDMPVAIFIQEAYNLVRWCEEDKEALLKSGLDWNYVTDLPLRLEVLSSLETSWIKKYNEPKELAIEIKGGLAEAA